MAPVVDIRHLQKTDTDTAAERKPWHAPKRVSMDIDETATDFIAVTDNTSFFS